jgi:hypothetical protein
MPTPWLLLNSDPKLFERIYAPLVAGLLQPFSGDGQMQQQKRSRLKTGNEN